MFEEDSNSSQDATMATPSSIPKQVASTIAQITDSSKRKRTASPESACKLSVNPDAALHDILTQKRQALHEKRQARITAQEKVKAAKVRVIRYLLVF